MEKLNNEKQNRNEEQVVLLDNNASSNFEIELGYVLIRCKKCHTSWGATPVNGGISKKAFICRNCAKEKIYQEMIKK
jgi:hypothetical protein